jgi:hypothetical protein
MFGTVFAAWYVSPVLSAPTVLVKTRVRPNPASRASNVRTAIRAAAPATP